jgi:hypothetical protein
LQHNYHGLERCENERQLPTFRIHDKHSYRARKQPAHLVQFYVRPSAIDATSIDATAIDPTTTTSIDPSS